MANPEEPAGGAGVDQELEVLVTPALDDNYVYLIRDVETGVVGVVDPGDGGATERALSAAGWTPQWILLTHHHQDHVAGVDRLRSGYGAKVVGAAADAERLPALDVALRADEPWEFGAQFVEVIDTPGHTVGHIAFHFPRAAALFCGDTLFAMGCGRVFEGTALQMWTSLSKLAALPSGTRVYAGHEYTLSNARFALTIEPENAVLVERAAEVERLRADDKPTLPTTIGREHATNPFLRASEPTVKTAVGMPGADDAAVFAEIRRRKDAA